MCFHLDARICVDEVLSEIYRSFKPASLELLGASFCRDMASGRDTDKQLRGVALEQTKYIGRQFYDRRHRSDTPKEFDAIGNLGVGKGLRSLPITLFRIGAARFLANLDQAMAEAAIGRAAKAASYRLSDVKERTKREFFGLMLDDLDSMYNLTPKQAEEAPTPVTPVVAHPVSIVDASPDTDYIEVDEDDFYIPSYGDFEFVFDQYPYVQSVKWDKGLALAVGYTSAKHMTTDRLIRRNCKVTFPNLKPKTFKDLGSLAGLLKDVEGHKYLKVVNLVKGTVIKCWTNIRGSGDQENMYRYIVVVDDQVGSLKSYPSEEMALMARDALLSPRAMAQMPLAIGNA